jgi:hypothetical protein
VRVRVLVDVLVLVLVAPTPTELEKPAGVLSADGFLAALKNQAGFRQA